MFGKVKNALVWVVWKTLPSCKDVTVLVSRSMESELSLREKFVMKMHLWSCVACQRYLKQLKFMSRVFELQDERVEKGEFSPALSSEASERLKKALKSSKSLMIIILLNFVNA